MKKQSKTNTLRSRLFKLLPSSLQTSTVRVLARRGIANEPVEFPPRLNDVTNVVVVLPESLLEAVYQVDNIMALLATFAHARVFYLCERDVAAFFRNVSPEATIIEYDRAERFLFSAPFTHYARTLAAQHPEVAILLERHPDLSLLSLMSRTAARYRIGYEGSGEFPFLNLRIRPTEDPTYLPEVNSSLARCLGASPQKPIRWKVAKEAREGLDQLLSELGFGASTRLIGIDGLHFYSRFGQAWTAQLLSRLREVSGCAFYCIPDHNASEDTLAWLKEHGLAIMPPVSLPRLTALIHRSRILITGNTVNFQLARLLNSPSIGLFDRASMDTFFKPADLSRSVAYEGHPTEESAGAVVAHIRELNGD